MQNDYTTVSAGKTYHTNADDSGSWTRRYLDTFYEWSYTCGGNFKRPKMWFVDSCDLGKTWTSPRELHFKGFKPPGINWAQIARVVDAAGISGMVSRHQA